jgi:D-aminoacyl-tRNA deacylase
VRGVVQRVRECSVTVDERIVGSIRRGLLVYVGVASDDEEADATYLADKVARLRIFEDEAGKMNKSVLDLELEALVVSQFTLCADTRKGRRPSYNNAAPPEKAVPLYEQFIGALRSVGLRVAQGEFQARMDVTYVNEGPVTILLDSKKQF